MARFGGPGDPFVVANPRASRLQDADRSARVLDDVRRAVEAATGRTPRIVVEDDLIVAEAALDEAAADGAAMIAVIGGDGTVRDAATRLAGTEIPLAIVPAERPTSSRPRRGCRCASPRPLTSSPTAGPPTSISGGSAGEPLTMGGT